MNGTFLDQYETPVPAPPCEAVLTERKLVHYPDRILDLYPDEAELFELGAVSYMGVPLFDADGEIMGHLAVLDTKPLPPEPRLISLFEIFAARAAAECRQTRIEQQMRARAQQVSALLESAMDGIVVLEEETRALDASDGEISGASGAAALLGIPASTLSSRLKALGVERRI